jgi:hypothetical protein
MVLSVFTLPSFPINSPRFDVRIPSIQAIAAMPNSEFNGTKKSLPAIRRKGSQELA